MARILEDSTQASEVNSKVAFVLTVVPGCTEEQVHLALHDNNYDLDKTISALLDSDGVPSQVCVCVCERENVCIYCLKCHHRESGQQLPAVGKAERKAQVHVQKNRAKQTQDEQAVARV